MIKSKKITSIILAVLLIISVATTVFVVSATAKETAISVSVDKTELSAGDSATVSVKVTANYSIATMSIPVFYDKTLVEVSEATAILTDYAVSSTTTDTQSVDSNKVYANTGLSSSKFGFVLVNYIGGAGEEVPETMNDVVLTFKITAKENVSGDAAIKCVSESAKTDENVAGMLYFGSPASGTEINAIPENIEKIDFTNATENVTIGGAKNTIALKDGAPFEAIIDLDNNIGGEYTGTIYGFDTLGWNEDWTADGAIADFITTAYGDDYLEVIVPEDAGVETTGTVINVLDDEGNVVESYVYIYFGDMDMDGNVGASDSGMAFDYESLYEGIDSLDVFMAGDLDADTMPGASDAGVMYDWEALYEGMPYQVDVAAGVYGIVYEIY